VAFYFPHAWNMESEGFTCKKLTVTRRCRRLPT
jgi:hypothetical protein